MIAVRLREAMERFRRRTGNRITYRQLSERTGISESTLQSIAARKSYNTTLHTVDRIASALDCPLDVLLEQLPLALSTTQKRVRKDAQGPRASHAKGTRALTTR